MGESDDRIAIIGVGCRMPPNANSLTTFWKFLLRGGNALRSIRKDRWDWRQYYDEDPKRPGKTNAPKAASLDMDLRQFDPMVFGISPREAASIDPQQRLLLEAAWEAFEDAGIPVDSVAGSATGVIIGGFCLDHLVMQMQPSNRHLANAQTPAGVMMTVLSNRLSHAFDLRGPSFTLDTACSSSLVTLHYACQSLRHRECDMMLAGGVNAMMRPDFPIIMSKGYFLSHHGECHTFDASAAGYARGEGAGILLLKRYDDAVAAGDTIHAVVRASGVNQDGHTDGISLPNSDAQEALVRAVYEKAGVSTADVDYVEAHGTGTQAGDAAELAALNKNFAGGRKRKLLVGSVKTNIGHLEAAAGVAGALKAICILKERQVPRNLHFKNPNPAIPFDQYEIEIPTETRTLPSPEEKPILFVGINSFGYGGTNAHILLESAPAPTPTVPAADSGEPRLIPFSARSEDALRDLAGKYAFILGQNGSIPLADLQHTCVFHRSHLSHRMVAIASDLATLREELIAASTGQPQETVVMSGKDGIARAPLVFVYTGMGPQWWAMGRELFSSDPIASATLDEVDSIFTPLAGWSLKSAMLADEAASKMAHTEVAQPANFALQLALTRIWENHGVRPAAVVGHSVGEVTAAYVAGVYTLEEAVRVSYHRSRLQQTMAGRGAMLAVGLPEKDALALIANHPEVSIAAINSFSSVTLSGDTEALHAIAVDLETRDVFQKFLRVEVAYHSPQMDPLRAELLPALADLKPKPAALPLYSTAHGLVSAGEEWNAEYWWHNVRQPVRFAAAIQNLIADGFSTFLEIGPHPVLGNSIKECAAALEKKVFCHASLRRAEPERPRMLLTLAELYCAGVDPDWSKLAPISGGFVRGPQYPWKRQRHWVESERSTTERLGTPGPPYLNWSISGPGTAWEVEVNRNYFPFLFDHGVQDQTVFAGMGYVEAALSAARTVHDGPIALENVSFEHVLVVDYSKIQMLMTDLESETGRFRITSRTIGEDGSQVQCRGRFRIADSLPRIDLESSKAKCPRHVAIDAYYEDLRHRGLHYGPAFRPTTAVFVDDDSFYIEIDSSGVEGETDHVLHPTLFDSAIQPVLFCSRKDRLFVPFSVDRFEYLSRPGAACRAVGRLVRETESAVVADVWLTDADGNVHAHAKGMACQIIETDTRDQLAGLLFSPRWEEAPIEEFDRAEVGPVLVVGNDSKLAASLCELIPGSRIVDGIPALRSRLADAPANRVVVLWGNDTPAVSASDAAAMGERVVELFQTIAGGAFEQVVEVTLVTRDAACVLPDDRLSNLAAAPSAAIGLVAQNEFDQILCRSIDLPAAETDEDAERIHTELAVGSAGEIAYRNGKRWERVIGSHRLENPESAAVDVPVSEPVRLSLVARGKVAKLQFGPLVRTEPADGEIELRVLGIGLNREDVAKIEGRFHRAGSEGEFWEGGPGMECMGEVIRAGTGSRFVPGDRVVSLLPGLFQTYATISDQLAVTIPDELGPEAAAIPVSYLTAWCALVDVANLRKGEKVFIHQAAGGVGLAAVDIARWIGAEVVATAGSDERRAMIRELGVSHVFDSRSAAFDRDVVAATAGGVVVVVGAFDPRSRGPAMGCLRDGGRHVELSRRDVLEDRDLALRAFRRNISFTCLDIDLLARTQPARLRESLETVLKLVREGELYPCLARRVAAGGIAAAIAELSENRNLGKLWVDLSGGVVEMLEQVDDDSIIRGDGSYLVVGGTAGFGLATAKWLAAQGAGRIVLASRSGAKASGLSAEVTAIESFGCIVEVVAADVARPEDARSLLEVAGTGEHPLRGIIHGAMVLEDAMMAELTPESFRKVFQPKAVGAWNLVQNLAEKTPDFVIFYSSISSLIGNRGQTSYVAANAYLDGLAAHLCATGVAATSINWGALSEAGVVARDKKLGALLSSSGVTGLTNRKAFQAISLALRESPSNLGVFEVDWGMWFESHPRLLKDPRFREQRARAGGGTLNEAAAKLHTELADSSKEQRTRVIETHLQGVLANTLKMPEDEVVVTRRLNELGVDSLMVLELSLGIEERIGARFSAMEFLKGPTIEQLATMAVRKLWPA